MEQLIKDLENACEKTLSAESDKQVIETMQVINKALTLIYNTQIEVNNLDMKLNSPECIYSFNIAKTPKCKMSSKVKVTKPKAIKEKKEAPAKRKKKHN